MYMYVHCPDAVGDTSMYVYVCVCVNLWGLLYPLICIQPGFLCFLIQCLQEMSEGVVNEVM